MWGKRLRDAKNKLAFGMGIITLLAFLPASGFAETPSVPPLVNYQGKLTNATGGALADGTYGIQFRLWENATLTAGEQHIWGRAFSVTVVGGQFNVILSDGGQPIAGETFAVNSLAYAFGSSNRYLGITIASGPGISGTPSEIAPRQQILSAPFALKADNGAPVGTILPFYDCGGKLPIPDGWQKCDGSAVADSNSPLIVAGIPTVPKLNDGRYLRGAALTSESSYEGSDSTGIRDGGTDINAHKHELPVAFQSGAGACLPGDLVFGGGSTNNYWWDHIAGGGSLRPLELLLSNVPFQIDLNAHTHILNPKHFDVIYIIRIR